jgi:hypothetical protein
VIQRLRLAPRAPLAAAGILATPIFFVALMAFALLLDKPASHVGKNGAVALARPPGSTVATIYLASFAVSLGLVLVGVLAMFLPGRVAGVVVAALAAIAAVVALLLPLGRWEDEHTGRYPLGVDLIPKKSVEDLILRGEWEANARLAAQEIGYWTIGLAVAAIVVTIMLDVRRRRGRVGPAVPPPPDIAAGEPQVVPQASQLP